MKEEAVLFWFIHADPHRDLDKTSAKDMWNQFLREVFDRTAYVFLDASRAYDKNRQGILALERNGQLYHGGWQGYGVSSNLIHLIPEHQNVVLGFRIGYCVKSHVDYLIEIGVPRDQITVLGDYSFCCDSKRHIEEAVKTYEDMDVHVLRGDISVLLD